MKTPITECSEPKPFPVTLSLEAVWVEVRKMIAERGTLPMNLPHHWIPPEYQEKYGRYSNYVLE